MGMDDDDEEDDEGARMRVHGVVGCVRLEGAVMMRRVMMAFGLRDYIHRRQSFRAGQQTLIQSAEYIALQLQIECAHNCQQGIPRSTPCF